MMTAYWFILCMAALFGMFVGYLAKDQKLFLINGAMFMFDLYMLLEVGK